MSTKIDGNVQFLRRGFEPQGKAPGHRCLQARSISVLCAAHADRDGIVDYMYFDDTRGNFMFDGNGDFSDAPFRGDDDRGEGDN